jgi:hypothetical protein
MIETQLAQLAALVSSAEDTKILGQPVSSCENVCALTTRWDKQFGRAQAVNYPWEFSAIVTERILVNLPSLALYTTRKLGMPSVTLARVST